MRKITARTPTIPNPNPVSSPLSDSLIGSSKKDISYYPDNSTVCWLYVPCRNRSVWVCWDEVEIGNGSRISLLWYGL